MAKYILFLIIIFNLLLISCSKSYEGRTVETNVEETFGGELLTTTITPFSVSFDNDLIDHLTYYVTSNKESLEKLISEIVKNHSRQHSDYPDISIGYSSGKRFYETIYGLESNTSYYYIVICELSDNIKISPIKEFKTEEINLYVTLEGNNVIWCGVNFIENRGIFKDSQFMTSQLFYQNSLPDPSEETIPGKWRYPTKAELEQLSKTCKITLIDFKGMFVRLTDNNNNNLYIPFTDQFDEPNRVNIKGCAFPYLGGEGGLILNIGKFSWNIANRCYESPIFEESSLEQFNERPMSVSSEYFYDIILNGILYKKDRGVRFVMDK